MEINKQDCQKLTTMVERGMNKGWLDQNPDQILVNMQDDLAMIYVTAGVVRAGEAVNWSAQLKQFLQTREQQIIDILCNSDTGELKVCYKTFLGEESLPSLLNTLAVDLLPVIAFNPDLDITKYFPLAAKLAFYTVRVGLDSWCKKKTPNL
jgi:hypothetical protein